MAKKIKFGIIGLSEGNGHPYSWSAIFNGYNIEYMKDCTFPVIPEYLEKEIFPENFLTELGEVTHIWTQNLILSNHIAKASNIPFVLDNFEDMIGAVDAVLLARDDAQSHFEFAQPFIDAGLPIFIDKPLALSLEDANRIFNLQKYNNQIYTCSSLRYAEELILSDDEKIDLGEVQYIEASIMKKWETYAIHLIEPIIVNMPNRGQLKNVKSVKLNQFHSSLIQWEHLSAYLKVTGTYNSPLQFKYYGTKGTITKEFKDSFACFKKSLKNFVDLIQNKGENHKKEETLEIVEIIQKGL